MRLRSEHIKWTTASVPVLTFAPWGGTFLCDWQNRSKAGAGKGPDIQRGNSIAQIFDRHIVRRVPEGTDGLHVRKFEHHHRAPVVLALKHLDFPVSRDELSAKSRDERHHGFPIFLELSLVADCTLD